MSRSDTVLLALSGGVDSAVAALLLKERGLAVTGAFFRMWSEPPFPKGFGVRGEAGCGWKEERRSALAVAAALDIPLVTLDFEEKYRREVLQEFHRAYAAGETPNPDVLCNSRVKFPLLRAEADRRGIAWIATGHHAQVRPEALSMKHETASGRVPPDMLHASRFMLQAGRDAMKDQSYFLSGLSQDDLVRTLFPIGELTKDEVRAKAKSAGLGVWDRRSTRGICFVGRVDLPAFLRRTVVDAPGPIVTTAGMVVGRHQGVHAFTIGQRHGFGGGGGTPYFVVAKDRATATLTVSADERDLLADEATLRDIHWIAGVAPTPGSALLARPRYRAPLVPATFDGTTVRFSVMQRALAPGQQVVFYDGEECLGGGTIAAVPAPVAAVYT